MNTRILALLGLMSMGCGVEEEAFLLGYTESICAHALECADPAVRTFDGFLDQETCVGLKIASVTAWGEGCVYESSFAAQCLDELSNLTCPGGGDVAAPPSVCDLVYANCTTGAPPAPVDTADSGL